MFVKVYFSIAMTAVVVANAFAFSPSFSLSPTLAHSHALRRTSMQSRSRPHGNLFMQLRPEDKDLPRTAAFGSPLKDSSFEHQTTLQQTASGVMEMPATAADVRRVWYETSHLLDNDEDGGLSTTAARAMVMLAAVLCGTNFGAVKLLQDTMDAPLLLTVRFLLCAFAMSPFLKKLDPRVVWPAAQTGTLLGLGYLTQAVALETAPAGVIAFLCSLTTITCPFIEKVTGVRVGMQGWAACALAVLGAAVLELGGSSAPGVGDWFGLLQPVMFGLFFWKTEQAMREFPDQALPFTTVQVFVCALLGAAWSALDAGGMPDLSALSHMSDVGFDLALLWLGLVSTAGVLVLQTLALAKLPSSETAVVFSSEPLWGMAFANVLLGEAIGPNTIVGGSLIIAACIVRVAQFDLEPLQALLRGNGAFAKR